MPIDATTAHLRAKIAAQSRRPATPERSAAVTAARRDLAAAKLAKYIERVVSEAPELTTAQLDELRSLFRPRSAVDGRVSAA